MLVRFIKIKVSSTFYYMTFLITNKFDLKTLLSLQFLSILQVSSIKV